MKTRRPRAYWTPAMEEHLVTTLVGELRGHKNVIRRDAELAAAKAVNVRFAPPVAVTTNQVQNKLTNASEPNLSTRSKYKIYSALTKANGFSWNGEVVTAPEEVWEAYIQAHPDASAFHNTPWPIYKKLRQLFIDLPGPGQPTIDDSQLTVAQNPSSANGTEAKAKQAKAEPSEAQPSEAQPSEAQPSEAQPSEAQPSEAQPSEAQPSEAQPSEVQPSEAQPSEAQPSQLSSTQPSPDTHSTTPPQPQIEPATTTTTTTTQPPEPQAPELQPPRPSQTPLPQKKHQQQQQQQQEAPPPTHTLQTKGELAITILQTQYAHLDDWTLVVAFTIMEDHTKAALFQAMNPGSVRDKWLALQVGQEKFRGLKT